MAQTKDGAVRRAAKAIGVSEAEYRRRREWGQKWCSRCRAWHGENKFGKDASRYDGLSSSCLAAKAMDSRRAYTNRARQVGKAIVPPRDGDKRQARRRVNYLVEIGLLVPPNDLDCVDCGHSWKPGERRHEYDHYKGYDARHHECVEPVCSRCHHLR